MELHLTKRAKSNVWVSVYESAGDKLQDSCEDNVSYSVRRMSWLLIPTWSLKEAVEESISAMEFLTQRR
jgi:hypothetical protein